jgi:hypothetical protein
MKREGFIRRRDDGTSSDKKTKKMNGLMVKNKKIEVHLEPNPSCEESRLSV